MSKAARGAVAIGVGRTIGFVWGPKQRPMSSRREEGGLRKVERTVLLRSVARHSKDPLFPNAAIWGREMEGWDFHNALTGD